MRPAARRRGDALTALRYVTEDDYTPLLPVERDALSDLIEVCAPLASDQQVRVLADLLTDRR